MKIHKLVLGLLLVFTLSSHAQVFNVLDFGAKGDGITLDSNSIRAAFAASTASNGGVVVFPKGYTFLTGPFNISANTIVSVEGVILASNNSADYLLLPILPWFGTGLEWMSVVHSYNVSNISITGGGVIDGQGQPWWGCASNLTLPPCNGYSRPGLIRLVYGSDIRIHNVTIKDSPNWTTHLAWNDRVHIFNVTILAPASSHNTDGLDVDCSQDVLLEDSYVSVGDDFVSVKSGVDWYGRTYGRPSKNVMIRNTIVGTSHGCSIGSEMSGGVNNVTFENILMNATGTGVRMVSKSAVR
jgi:polygalacturonase